MADPVAAASAPVDGHRTLAELEGAVEQLRESPADRGRVEMLVVRPAENERRTPDRARLSTDEGLEGDDWSTRPGRGTPDGGPHPDRQLTLINRRLLELVAGPRQRWPLAGDQLVVDLDLRVDNLRAGDRLRVGGALVEVTAQAHRGCAKFAARYGRDALRLVNSPVGRELRLRGVYVRVIEAGEVAVGDTLAKDRGDAGPPR